MLPDTPRCSVTKSPQTTKTGIEEKRRIWWAIFVLDRVVCLGNKRRYLLPHPTEKETLPSDDASWVSQRSMHFHEWC